VAVEGSPGHDIGTVSLAGELVKVQMKKRKINEDHEDVKKIYRKASQRDIDIWQQSRAKETVPISCPGEPSTATISPIVMGKLSGFL